VTRSARRFFALAALLLLVGADDGAMREQIQRRIERMTPAERARLERNFRAFLALGESERDRYRKLHRDLEADAQSGGKLRDLLRGYSEWLASLTPYQREEIRNETDPIARAQLVRRLRNEQREQSDRAAPRRQGLMQRTPAGGLERLLLAPRLQPADLDALTAILEEDLGLNAKERQRLHALPPRERHLHVLKQALLAELPGPARGGPARWPDDALLDRMIRALTTDSIRNRLLMIREPQRRRQALGLAVAGALAAEWRPELDRVEPQEEELKSFFLGLDPARREELINLPPDERRQRIAWEFLAQDRRELRDLFQVMQRLMPRPDRPAPPREGPRPPGEGPDAAGPSLEGGPPGRRPNLRRPLTAPGEPPR